MAIKIKGKLPLKICSVLFVLYGAASLVALLLCLVMVVGLIPAAMAAGPEGDRNYITFKANDGSYGSSSERLQQLTESDVAIGWVTLRANDFNRDGYTFLGWSTEPNGQKIYNDGQTVSVTELFGGRTYAVLYAVWQKDGVTPPVHGDLPAAYGGFSDGSRRR